MGEKSFDIRPFIIMFAACLLFALCLDMTGESLFRWEFYVVFIASALMFATLFKSLNLSGISVIIFLGILLRFVYIFYTATWSRQHDVVDFGTGEGHAGYIEYILEHKALPDFDPRDVWAFFQPPLHHIISAIWVKITLYAGVAYRQAQECIQLLTFFYSSATALFSYFILKELKIGKWGTYVAMLIISFHPMYIIMSGSINNDAISLLFMVISLYLSIVWYKRGNFGYLIILALSVGLAMFAKLSGALVAPAIAVLFIIKLVKSQPGSRLKLIGEYVVFALICVPIGLFWSIRNALLFDMPFNYIPHVGEHFDYLPIDRILDYTSSSVFMAMKENGDAFYEHNVILALIKSSLFDDANLVKEMPLVYYPSLILFWVAVILIALALVATVYVLLDRGGEFIMEWRILLGVMYFTIVIAYFSFALGYDNFSAQNFRYGSLAIIIEAIFLGRFTDCLVGEGTYSKGRGFATFIMITTLLFAVSSFVTYFWFGFARA